MSVFGTPGIGGRGLHGRPVAPITGSGLTLDEWVGELPGLATFAPCIPVAGPYIGGLPQAIQPCGMPEKRRWPTRATCFNSLPTSRRGWPAL